MKHIATAILLCLPALASASPQSCPTVQLDRYGNITQVTDCNGNTYVDGGTTTWRGADGGVAEQIGPSGIQLLDGTILKSGGGLGGPQYVIPEAADGGVAVVTGTLTTTPGPIFTADGGPIQVIQTQIPLLVEPSDGGFTVAVSNFPGTQTVSGTVTATQATGSNLHIAVDSMPTTTVTGTTTANQGAALPQGSPPWPVAPEATDGGCPITELTDGTNPLGVGSNPIRVDPTGTTNQPVSGTVAVSNFPGTQPVSGTVTANAGTGTFAIAGTVTSNAGTGTFTVGQGTAANLNATVVQSSGSNLHVDVDSIPSATVSGTVTSNQGAAAAEGTPPWPVAPQATDGGFPITELTDGTNLLATSSHPVRTDPTGTTTQPVSGTVTANAGTGTFAVSAASLPLPSGAATSANQTNGTQQTEVVQGGNVATVTASSALKVDGSAVTQPVSGTVTSNAGTGTFAVSAVSLPLPSGAATSANQTNGTQETEIVQGGNVATVSAAGAQKVDGSAVTQPVSGTVTAAQATAASLNATVVQATGSNLHVNVDSAPSTAITTADGTASGIITTQNLVPTGTATAGSAVAITIASQATLGVQVSGVYTGALSLQATVDGTNWVTIGGSPFLQPSAGTFSATIVSASTGVWNARISGYAQARVTALSAVTGTATVTLRASLAKAPDIDSLPAGTNSIGTVVASQPTAASLNATVVQATGSNLHVQVDTAPTTTVTGTVTVAQATAANLNATVVQSTGANLHVDVDSAPSTAVTGTVTSNQGTANTLANGWPTELTDGTHGPAAVTAASTAVTAANPSLAVGLSPNSPLPAGSNALGSVSVTGTTTVAGTVTSNIGTTNGLALDTSVNGLLQSQGATSSGTKGPLVQGAVTTSAPTYSNAQTDPLSLTTAGALRVDASSTTQPVSGTVTANAGTGTFAVSAASLPLPTGAATSSNQTTLGSQTSKINDGTNTAAVKAASTAAATTDPAVVAALSPNSPTPVGPDTGPVTATLGALNATCTVTLAGQRAASALLSFGATLAGTVKAQVSPDGAGTWNNTTMVDTTTGVIAGSLVLTNPNPGSSEEIVVPGGTRQVRLTVTAYTSGSTTCTITATQATDTIPLAKLTDGTNVVAATAPSTAAVASQPAEVVAISPNSPATVVQATGSNLHVQVDTAPTTTVTGTVATTQSGSWTNTVTQATAASLNATVVGPGSAGSPSGGVLSVQGVASGTAMPVSGTVTSNAGTGTFTTATSDATATGNITTQNLVPGGTATAGSAVTLALNGASALDIGVTGTYTGALSVQFSPDGTNWSTAAGNVIYYTTVGLSLSTIASAQVGDFVVNVSGHNSVRVTALAAVTGTAAVVLRSSTAGFTATQIVQLSANQSMNLTQIGGNVILTAGVAGSQAVGGTTATGTTLSGNPVLVAGSDGTNVRNLSTDTSGRAQVAGAAANGGVLAGNPVLVAGSDGTDARNLNTDTTGHLILGAGTNGIGSLTAGTAVIGVVGNTIASTTSGQSGELVQGAVTTANPTYSNTQTDPLSLSTFGNLRVQSAPVDGVKNTYIGHAAAAFTPAASATDIFVLTGSASVTVRVTRVVISCTQTTSAGFLFVLRKHSTADSGGTSSACTIFPIDSNDAAASATCLQYTANPTSIGSVVGSPRVIEWLVPAPATTSYFTPLEWDFGGPHPEQAIVLRGTSQQLAVNLNGNTMTGGSCNISMTWTEE